MHVFHWHIVLPNASFFFFFYDKGSIDHLKKCKPVLNCKDVTIRHLDLIYCTIEQ